MQHCAQMELIFSFFFTVADFLRQSSNIKIPMKVLLKKIPMKLQEPIYSKKDPKLTQETENF